MQTTNLAFSTAGIISMLVGFVLPILVGYFTKASLNPGLKAAILAAAAGVSGVLSQWLDAINNSQHFAWQAAVLSAVATWLVAEGSYLKIWKPSGISDTVQAAGPIADKQTVGDATDAVTQSQIGQQVEGALTHFAGLFGYTLTKGEMDQAATDVAVAAVNAVGRHAAENIKNVNAVSTVGSTLPPA